VSARDAAILVFVWRGVQAGLSATLLLQYGVFFSDGASGTVVSRVLTLVPIAFMAWLAYRLVRDRARFADAVFSGGESAGPAASAREVGVLGVAFIGLYILCANAPQFLGWLSELPTAARTVTDAAADPFAAPRVIHVLAGPIIGAVLLINRHAIAGSLFARAPE
jgi:hypothetical protein